MAFKKKAERRKNDRTENFFPIHSVRKFFINVQNHDYKNDKVQKEEL